MYGLYVFCFVFGMVILSLQFLGGVFDFDSGHHDVTLDKETVSHDHGDRGSSLNLLSIRGLSSGVTIFGAFGGMLTSFGLPIFLAFSGAAIAGLAANIGTGYLIKSMAKLSTDGSVDYRKAQGRTGTVYSGFGNDSRRGTIQISVDGEVLQISAESPYSGLRSGDRVFVSSVADSVATISPLSLT